MALAQKQQKQEWDDAVRTHSYNCYPYILKHCAEHHLMPPSVCDLIKLTHITKKTVYNLCLWPTCHHHILNKSSAIFTVHTKHPHTETATYQLCTEMYTCMHTKINNSITR